MPEQEGQKKYFKLKNIRDNPNRDFKTYPIIERKVEKLARSIRATGFNDNIVGRQVGEEEVQIAYGHHRLRALWKVYNDPEKEIPITIKDYSDGDMVMLMGNENDDEYNCPLAAIDDAVQAAQKLVKENPEAVRDILTRQGYDFKRLRPGAPVIAVLTGKPEGTVSRSLERLGWIASGEIDREALYSCTTQGAADRFARMVKEHNPTPEQQKAVAKRLVKLNKFGEATINQVFVDMLAKLPPSHPDHPGYFELMLRKSTKHIEALIRTLAAVSDLERQKNFFGGEPTREDISQTSKEEFQDAVNRLSDWIVKVAMRLDAKEEHEQ